MGKKSYCMPDLASVSSCAKARIRSAGVHFKNTVEVSNAVRGMRVDRALRYLKNVCARTECVPFRNFNGGVGRCAQAKNWGATQGRWPVKSARVMLDLITNAISNAEYNGMDTDQMVLRHVHVSQAPTRHRRTYRAHGVINPYISHPCHIQVVLVDETTKEP